MPETMRKDVEKLLEEVPPTRKRPERCTRKEQAKQALAGPSSAPTVTAAAASSTAAAPEEDQVTHRSLQICYLKLNEGLLIFL